MAPFVVSRGWVYGAVLVRESLAKVIGDFIAVMARACLNLGRPAVWAVGDTGP